MYKPSKPQLARELTVAIVTMLLDLDDAGISGTKRTLGYLSQLTPVRLA